MDDANGVLRQSTEYDPATGKVACVWEYDETGTLRKSTEYDTDTGKAVYVQDFDERGQKQKVDCKDYENGILSFHWTAVYDESGIETRTHYDPATNKVTCIEIRDANGTLRKYTRYDRETGEILSVSEFDEQGREIGFKEFNNGTNKTCTITQYDVQTDKMYCVQVWEMNGEDDWKLLKETYYDGNGNITSEKEY